MLYLYNWHSEANFYYAFPPKRFDDPFQFTLQASKQDKMSDMDDDMYEDDDYDLVSRIHQVAIFLLASSLASCIQTTQGFYL